MHSPEQLSASTCRFPGANILSLLSAYKSQGKLLNYCFYSRNNPRQSYLINSRNMFIYFSIYVADLMKSAYERVDEREGWMTKYNVDHKFSSPWRVREAMQSIGIGDYFLSTLETFQVLFLKNCFSRVTSIINLYSMLPLPFIIQSP